MSDPLHHRCRPADLDYVWQRVELPELLAEIADRSMRNLVAHRTTICNACGRNWYLLEFDKLGAEPDEELGVPIERQHRIVCAPKPQALIDALAAAKNRAKFKGKKRAAA